VDAPQSTPAPTGTEPERPRLILIGGASGSGKSYLARRYGRPHLPLDAFYRQQADDAGEGGPGPLFPRTPYGEIDWDDPGTWDGAAATAAIIQLLEHGACQVPDYDISTSSVVGSFSLSVAPGGTIVAEGIFAEAMPPLLRQAGAPFEAWYIDQAPAGTAVRRFARDVAEHRKPLPFLIQRGWALFRSDGARRTRALAAGFTPRPKKQLKAELGRQSR
jgi:uridine kinase